MIEKIKPGIPVLIYFLFLQGVNCQIPSNMTDYLKERFSKYIKSVPREEIYIHTDRDEYISGEDLWFNIYLIDRNKLKPSADSKIAYFELLNSANRPVIQKRICLDKGFGPGQIVLPDTLSTGRYTIRAYTNWMKNFLPYNCFMKEINIYNAYSNRTIKGESYPVKIEEEDNRVQIYTDTFNSGLLTLKVNNLDQDILEINVAADEKYCTVNNNKFYLFIQTHGIINHISQEKIYNENTRINIPKDQLLSGINQITLFNSGGKPVAERFIFTPEKDNALITLSNADISLTRNKISLSLEIENGSTSSMNPANFSISVAPVTKNRFGVDLNDYMIFGTEYGLVPSKVIKNKKVSEIPPKEIDSLLMTVKSNWINWKVILADELPIFKYPVENEYHYISGKLISSNNGAADSDKFVILSSPGKIALFQYAKTNKEGIFNFGINISEKVNDLIIQPNEITKNKSINIASSFSDQYPKSAISVDSTNKSIPPYISKWSANNQIRKIYGISSVGAPLSTAISQPRIKRFYGKPETELIMKDYIALPVMQEVFFELLTGVLLKSEKSGHEITISDPVEHKIYDRLPGMFIDGVMVKNASVIAGLDPELVEEIDVVRDRYFIDDYLFYGIINIITKAGDFSNVTLPDDAIRLPYRVVDPIATFVSPDYSSEENERSRIPDFRNTLYWNPSVKPDKERKARIEFWASDYVSDYEINIQGITPEGKPYCLRKIIKVKSK
jgi:hypothetical protein